MTSLTEGQSTGKPEQVKRRNANDPPYQCKSDGHLRQLLSWNYMYVQGVSGNQQRSLYRRDVATGRNVTIVYNNEGQTVMDGHTVGDKMGQNDMYIFS